MAEVKIIECPRDAMQGIHEFIPTHKKTAYLRTLLNAGFDTIDFGSFVSPKYIPQMRDTAEVLAELSDDAERSRLLAIVANVKGAHQACQFKAVDYLGFPFSISEEFQRRNTNASMQQALQRVDKILDLCDRHNKELVIYISMAFGNPYGEKWNVDIAAEWVRIMVERGLHIISLADTIGSSTPENISYLLSGLISTYPSIEFGAHIHCRPDDWREKLEAAFESGCRRFDGAVRGLGGCPMAADDLVGNMPTESILRFMEEKGIETGVDKSAFDQAMKKALITFP